MFLLKRFFIINIMYQQKKKTEEKKRNAEQKIMNRDLTDRCQHNTLYLFKFKRFDGHHKWINYTLKMY